MEYLIRFSIVLFDEFSFYYIDDMMYCHSPSNGMNGVEQDSILLFVYVLIKIMMTHE
jgi:hypothetical protein